MDTPSRCQDLFEFINEKGCPSEERACDFIYKVLKTVIGCYHLGVIHRDIKPENVLVDLDSFELTLIDFGGGSLVKRTAYKEKIGSWEFYPPEWYTNDKYHAEPLTVWSLGITFYYMVWGDVPFKTIEKIKEEEVKFPIKISSACKNIITKCLNKNPNERASLLDILKDLEDLRDQISNNAISKVPPNKPKSMPSTSNSSNDSSTTNSEFRSIKEESIEDNFFKVNTAKKRKYQYPQILTDSESDSADPIANDIVSKKAKYEFDTDHQTENESDEPVIDSIDNYQFGTDDEFEDQSDSDTDDEIDLDKSFIDVDADTDVEAD